MLRHAPVVAIVALGATVWFGMPAVAATPDPDDEGSFGLVAVVRDSYEGPLSLVAPATGGTQLSPPQLENYRSVTRGALTQFSISDERGANSPGWVLSMQVSDFVNSVSNSVRFPGTAAGIRPIVLAGDGVVAAPETVAGQATYPAEFASAAAGRGSGTTTLGGDVTVLSPNDKPEGTYLSTVTFTLTSR